MTAFVVSRIDVRDPQKMKDYSGAAGPTLAAFGAEVVLRGSFAEAFLGVGTAHATGIIRFPDLQSARDWFASDAYQSLKDLREAAGDMEFFVYQAA